MTMLEELTKDFPATIGLKLRETIDRTRIKNPNDPIFELMIVLGIWAKYYESIPDGVKSAGVSVTQSLDPRVKAVKEYAQTIQKAVDRMEIMPQQIVDKFPTEQMATGIARKINERFDQLPLIELERDLDSLERSIQTLLGKDGATGLAKQVETGIKDLNDTVKSLNARGFVEDQTMTAIVWMIIGALIAGLAIWLAAVRPMAAKINPQQSYYYQ